MNAVASPAPEHIALDPARGPQEGVLHRRGRDARALRRALRDSEGRLLVDFRPVGLRQVDAAVDPRPARHADAGALRAERHAGRAPRQLAARPHSQQGDRLHLPGVQPDRRPHGVRERRAAAHVSRRDGREGAQGARGPSARARADGASAPALSRRSSRAVSSSASRSRARSSAARRSCSPTSRPETWTRRTARP